jgi:spore germination protein YaaH
MLLLALLAALGPHAAQAELHARDPDAAWVHAAPALVRSPASAPSVTRRVYGYLPYWESIDLAALRWDLVTDVIAFSAGISTGGAISNSHSLPGAALVQAAHSHGVKVHLCATLFNSSGGSEVATFLADTAARASATQQLVSLAAGIDGLDLDFEFVPGASKAAFTAFVQSLHSALRSAIPAAELTIAMPSSTGWSGYDAPALAAATERLLLMEYDFHSGGSNAGPQAPLTTGGFWGASVEGAVGTFLAVVPASALAMGVPYYGLEWPTVSAVPGAGSAGSASTVLFKNAFAKFAAYGRLWDAPSQTPWYEYSAGGQEHQGWVDDGQSLALKYQYVNSKDLAGIMIWTLGYDNGRTESWAAIQDAFVPPAPPPADAGAPPDAGLETAPDGGTQPNQDLGPLAASRGCSHAAGAWIAIGGLFALARRKLLRTAQERV